MRPTRQVRSLLLTVSLLAVAIVGGICGVAATTTLTDAVFGRYSSTNANTPVVTTTSTTISGTVVIAMNTEALTTARRNAAESYRGLMEGWVAEQQSGEDIRNLADGLGRIEAPAALAAAHAILVDAYRRMAADPAASAAIAGDPSVTKARQKLEDALGFKLAPS